ncbi:hypothetical protein AVEN_244236-1 [Araneus ventricosus]|uniref:Uncharacterized protein n=1 Tax=Araneus ventricosus TaxID=182803 RepID=A0A4Y2KSW8_ARAVE|nr:hypothetical protein AVEN_244236-1 [Araneus ventricosus]
MSSSERQNITFYSCNGVGQRCCRDKVSSLGPKGSKLDPTEDFPCRWSTFNRLSIDNGETYSSWFRNGVKYLCDLTTIQNDLDHLQIVASKREVH